MFYPKMEFLKFQLPENDNDLLEDKKREKATDFFPGNPADEDIDPALLEEFKKLPDGGGNEEGGLPSELGESPGLGLEFFSS